MKLKLACAQYVARHGDIAANLARIATLAAAAARAGAELLVLPELAVTGYARPEVVTPLAETIPGPSSAHLAQLAREHHLALAVGLVERDPASGALFNTMLLLDGTGAEVLRYHKVHLWDTEKAWATAGSDFPVATWRDITVGQWICYDTRFPEGVRSLAKAGAVLTFVSAAWLGPAEEWELALRSRAMDNGIFVAGSVHLGHAFHGTALIIDPHGTVIARGDAKEEGVICAEIDLSAVERFHARVPLLRHLRPDSYR